MLSQKNILHVFVGADAALATGTRAAMTNGQIGIFKNGSTTGTNQALAATDRFKVVLKDINGNLIESPLLTKSQVVANSTDYLAPTEKKVFVGYNGVAGSIAVANSSVYVIHMNLQDGTRTWGEHPLFKLVAAYKSDANATQTEIADGLVLNAVKNFEREASLGVNYMKVGRINSADVTAGNAFDYACAVVNSSNTVTLTTATTYSTGEALAVGDYIRLGSVGGGTTLKSEVYKVIAIDNLVVTLDRPVINATGTYAVATVDAEVIPSATAIAANWGLSFEAKALPFKAGLKKYAKLDFQVQISEEFAGTLVTVDTAPTKGQGSYQEVAEIEWDLSGSRGETYRVADWPVDSTLNAVVDKTYDSLVLDFTIGNVTDLDHTVNSYGTLLIFTQTTQANDALKTVFGL